MRSFSTLALLAFALLVMSACATTTTSSSGGDQNLTTQISNLERTQSQLRIQYNTMGETIGRLETRISELKAREAQRRHAAAVLPKPTGDNAPAPRTAPAREPVVANVDEPAKPTTLTPAAMRTPVAPSAAVGALTDDDLEDMNVQAAAIPAAAIPSPKDPAPASPSATAVLQAPPPVPEPDFAPAAAEPAVAANAKSYVLHLSSYTDTAPIKAGWLELNEQFAEPLKGLKPFLTPFEDKQHRHWLRLSAGPVTQAQAAERCATIKAAGTWCEVLEVSTASLRALR